MSEEETHNRIDPKTAYYWTRLGGASNDPFNLFIDELFMRMLYVCAPEGEPIVSALPLLQEVEQALAERRLQIEMALESGARMVASA